MVNRSRSELPWILSFIQLPFLTANTLSKDPKSMPAAKELIGVRQDKSLVPIFQKSLERQ